MDAPVSDGAHSELVRRLFVSLQVDRVSQSGAQVKAGGVFADGLLFIIGHPDCRLPLAIREAAADLASAVRAAGVAYRPNRRGTAFSPVDGLRSAKHRPAPVYCAVVRHRHEPDSYGWLRVALIEFALAGLGRDLAPGNLEDRSPMSASDVEVLQRLLYEPLLETGGDALYEWIQRAGTQLADQRGQQPGPLQVPDEALVEVSEGDREKIRIALHNAHAHIVGAALPRPEGARAAPARKPRPSKPRPPRRPLIDPAGTFDVPAPVIELRQGDPEAPPVEEFADAPLLAFASTPADVAVDEGDDPTDPVPAPSIAKAASGRRDARRRYDLYLSGSLQPEVQRSLTPPEYRQVMGYSAHRCEERVEVAPIDAAPSLMLLLSGLTSRHHVTVQHAIADWLEGGSSESGAFRIDGQGFWSQMPIAPEPDRKSERVVPPTIFLPWPARVRALLAHVAAAPDRWVTLLGEDLTEAVHEASHDIRRRIDTRFSLLRLRSSLAPAIYVGTGDEALAQIVTGDALHHSSAPLHYYSQKIGRVRRAFAWALADWLPSDWKWVVPSAQDDDVVFGMPRARLPDAEIRNAISELADRADQPPPPRADSEALCEVHQRFTAYVTALFAACTTHRFTEHLRQLTRRHLLLRWSGATHGLAIFVDKYTVNALSCRGAAMSALLVEQMEVYLAHLDRLRRRLEKHPHRNRLAVEALKAAVEGRGPLFVSLEHDPKIRGNTRARPFEAADLRHRWPEWRWPAYVLRHRFAAFHWRHAGISRDDVMRQMGHASEGVAFDESDPDSVLRFVTRLANPLDGALQTEGWRLVRSWMPQRVAIPPLARDRCGDIAAEQGALLSVHAKHQREATARAMGKFQVVARSGDLESHRATIIEAARELARKGLEAWLSHPDQAQISASKTMTVEDVSRLVDAVAASVPDRRYWTPALNVLRNRLQRMRTDAGWSLEIPPAIFAIDVAEPVVTPPCARAFIHCSDILRRCEEMIVRVGLDKPPDRLRWLGITAVEIAIRSGVTQRDRWISILANAARARRHPLSPDTLLIPTHDDGPISDETSVDDDGESPEQPSPQYITVQGLAAVCLQRWASISGQRSTEELRVDLVAAFNLVIAEGTQGDEILDEVLTAAELARRLTMPGVRAAWEAGRLAGRTLSTDRQMDAWQGVIRRQIESDETADDVPDVAQRIDHGSPTAEFLEAARLCIRFREHERGQPRSAERVSQELVLLAAERPGLPPTALWVQRYLLRRLAAIRTSKQRTTLYQEYTTFLTPFLLELGDLELADLDSIEQTELFERVLNDRVSDERRALQVILCIVREMNRDGVEGPDRQVLEAAVGKVSKVATAYLVSPAEHRWICGQLTHWLDEARQGSTQSPVTAFELDAARIVWELQYWIGLRPSENTHLRHAELIDVDGEWILQIRRSRRRGLKNSASVRPLRLRNFLPSDVFERFQNFVDVQRASFVGHDKTFGLFVPPWGQNRVARTRGITDALSAAMSLILPPGEGRPYAGRHVRATYGVQSALPEEHRSAAWMIQGAPECPGYLAGLPPRFVLRFWSRALGHATVRSSLEYYTHSLADLCWLDRGWSMPTLELLGCAVGVKPLTLGSRASRARIGTHDRAQLGGLVLDEFGTRTRLQGSAPAFESLGGGLLKGAQTEYPLTRLAEVAREWLRGDRIEILRHRHQIGAGFLLNFVRAIERLDHQYRAGIVDRHVPLDGIESRHLLPTTSSPDRRGPRRRLLVGLAKAYDELQARQPQTWKQWFAALSDQRDGLSRIRSDALDADTLHALVDALGSVGLRMSRDAGELDRVELQLAGSDGNEPRHAELGLIHLVILARAATPRGIRQS